MGNLVHEIGLWLSSMELPYNYTISLQTTSEPYGLTIHFDSVTAHVLGVERDIDKRMYAIAPSATWGRCSGPTPPRTAPQ